jgi:Phytanoyl-CoA dioxygenase (PhyH)
MIEATSPPFLTRLPALDGTLRGAFANDGYLVFDRVVDERRLEGLCADVLREFETCKAGGRLFNGGGTVSGHLNCFPGGGSRFVYETLEERGIFDVVRLLSPEPLREPNIGCNLNLPGSRPQNEHVDGYAARPFLIVNVAAQDTDVENGAMEIMCGTHRRSYKYWQLLVDRPERRRLCLKRGDVVIRISTLWHRGMPNLRHQARPMLAFTWENGGTQSDPYRVNDGNITFFPNRYGTGWHDRLRERAFATAPRAGTAYCAVRSLFKG